MLRPFPRANCQKSQALRMLVTSGVIRSATVDPPWVATPKAPAGS
jgi:hypothetical protein